MHRRSGYFGGGVVAVSMDVLGTSEGPHHEPFTGTATEEDPGTSQATIMVCQSAKPLNSSGATAKPQRLTISVHSTDTILLLLLPLQRACRPM